jgi:hypothetical protein
MMHSLKTKNKYSLDDMIELRSEGLDEVNFNLFETPHPFGRGHANRLEKRYNYQGALGFLIEFDN